MTLQEGVIKNMRSVPSRGSGWVRTSEDVNRIPTRYREVVLTSFTY
jgi:hypothetical protein